ncbi:MAG: 4Fe-4S binding protein [Phycisphaerales bacterium]|nr:MAG: 4Fe-4S binding protein [Phycisphaerales bacterium]
MKRWQVLFFFLMVIAAPVATTSVLGQYVRPVDIVPPDEDIGAGYTTPSVQRPLPRALWWNAVDSTLLAVAMALAAWIVLKKRSRNWLVVLTIVCLWYFGFHREGCICPIGGIQNISVALVDAEYAVPFVVILFVFLPLIAALLFGRVFCGGVCPLGGIQEIVLLKPVYVPRRLDKALGLFKYIYLAIAIWFAVQPAETRDFVICRFDPFVGFFRMSGPGNMLIFGGVLLILGIFVGRPYCRYLCPYGALLALLSRLSWRGVTITPDNELDCGLCTEACPYGAIEQMRAVRSSCLYCARCYASCPREPQNRPTGQRATDTLGNEQQDR